MVRLTPFQTLKVAAWLTLLLRSNGIGARGRNTVSQNDLLECLASPLADCDGRDTGGAKVTIPAEIGDTLWTDYDWKLKTVPQEFLNNRNVALNQGKVVGGGTILNGMVWTRGSARDYDAWGDLNDVEGRANEYNWRWEDLLPYFQKVRGQEGLLTEHG